MVFKENAIFSIKWICGPASEKAIFSGLTQKSIIMQILYV
jgi:hypothetical protein